MNKVETTDKTSERTHVDKQIRSAKAMLEYYQAEIKNYEKLIVWLESNRSKLEGLDFESYSSFISVKTSTRDVLMRVLKAFPGKWEKPVNGNQPDTLDYTLNGSPMIQCVGSPPPPSCQIVEELVEIPAQPARQEVRRVVKCTPDVEQAVDELASMAATEVF